MKLKHYVYVAIASDHAIDELDIFASDDESAIEKFKSLYPKYKIIHVKEED